MVSIFKGPGVILNKADKLFPHWNVKVAIVLNSGAIAVFPLTGQA